MVHNTQTVVPLKIYEVQFKLEPLAKCSWNSYHNATVQGHASLEWVFHAFIILCGGGLKTYQVLHCIFKVVQVAYCLYANLDYILLHVSLNASLYHFAIQNQILL